jgi:hypothetical protein
MSIFLFYAASLIATVITIGLPIVALRLFRRNNRGTRSLLVACIIGIAFIASVILNPIANLLIGYRIDEHLNQLRTQRFVNKPLSKMIDSMGTPNHSWTNNDGQYVSFYATSPWFCFYKSDTLAYVSNGIVKQVWEDD